MNPIEKIMLDSKKWYSCREVFNQNETVNKEKMVVCQGPFNTLLSAKMHVQETDRNSIILPVCSFLPPFVQKRVLQLKYFSFFPSHTCFILQRKPDDI